jgi:hypothetical protein
MNYHPLLTLYPAHDIIEYNKDTCISLNRIEKVRLVLARTEIRTTLYGEKLTIYHEMVYNTKNEIVPRYFGPPIRKNTRNWLGGYYIKILLIYYQTKLPSLLNSKNSNLELKDIPFSDESNLVIKVDPLTQLQFDNFQLLTPLPSPKINRINRKPSFKRNEKKDEKKDKIKKTSLKNFQKK